MPLIRFICPDGEVEEIQVSTGTSLMEAAINHGIDSIVGDCGGSASCGTCHVYVRSHEDQLLPRAEEETIALEEAPSEVTPESRLACQIRVTPELEGVTVEVAPEQW